MTFAIFFSVHRIPTESDWNEVADADQTLEGLDVRHARHTFFGKSNEEMQGQFKNTPLGCAEDLGYLPRIPFQYYVLGFRDFVMAGKFGYLEAPDAASAFLHLIQNKLENQPHFILDRMADLLPAVIQISEHQALYEADMDIYGDFRDARRLIESLHQHLLGLR